MIITHCTVHTTADGVDAFIAASQANAAASRQEPGVLAFDCIQSVDDETVFCLVEHYRDTEAVEAHKTTEHFLAWREAVNPLMAQPRQTVRFRTLD